MRPGVRWLCYNEAMFSSLSHRDKVAVIGVFSIALFSMATIAYQQKTAPIQASLAVHADPKNINPTKRLAVATSEDSPAPSAQSAAPVDLPAQTAEPSASHFVSPTSCTTTTDSSCLAAVSTTTDTPSITPEIPIQIAAKSATTKPFYTDLRYILVMANGLVVFVLIVVLIIRLILKLFTQPGMQEPIDLTKKPGGPVTVDQLDMDIPL